MGELIGPAIDFGASFFGSGAAEDVAAPLLSGAGDVAEGIGEAAIPGAEAALEGGAPLSLTVGANAFGPELGAAAPGFFEGLGGAALGGLGALGSFFTPTPANALELPSINPPSFDASVPGAGGGPGAEPQQVVGGGQQPGLDASVTSPEPMNATPQKFAMPAGSTGQPGVAGAPGGASSPATAPGADATAVPTEPGQPTTTSLADQIKIAGPQGQPGTPGAPSPQASGTSVPAEGAAAGAPGAAGKSSPGFFDSIKAKDLAMPLVGAAGLGYNMLQNKKNAVPSVGQTGASMNQNAATSTATAAQQTAAGEGQQQAGQTTQQLGQEYASYLQKGELPPALQTQIDQATAAAIANAKSNAAKAGQPSDPLNNTSLAQSIAAIQQQAVVTKGQMLSQLTQTGAGIIGAGNQQTATGTSMVQAGTGAAGLSEQIYAQLAQIDQNQTAQVGKSIANFAAALSGKGPTINIGGNASA